MFFVNVSVNKSNKVPTSNQPAPKKLGKVKKMEKTKEKELPVSESNVAAEVPATCRRKRKPPGEWWLTQHDVNNMQEQQKAVQTSKLKSNKKTQKKTPVLTDSTEQELAMTSDEIQKEPVTVQKLPKMQKLSQAGKTPSNPAGSQKNAKSAGGRPQRKPGAQDQREVTPGLMVEEEGRDNEASGQFSPMACSQLPRQRSETPGKCTQ